MGEFHCLRPWWLLMIFPLLGLLACLWRQNPYKHSWQAVCDRHLLDYLLRDKGSNKRRRGLLCLFSGGLLMVVSLAGPAWLRLPVPSWRAVAPRVVVLDMSENMLEQDISPDRLTRARFKLQDLFRRHEEGQFGLVVFTGESFVVSPLTEDSNTINSLVETLTPEIMPVSGHRLDTALEQAAQLISAAGFTKGQLLVLTASPPDAAAISMAATLEKKGIETSIMPVMADRAILPIFKPLASAGHGLLLPYANTSQDLDIWLKKTSGSEQLTPGLQKDIPLWRDEGRWFLWPALLLLLPVFWRGWLLRIES